jgi:hypothetical protein
MQLVEEWVTTCSERIGIPRPQVVFVSELPFGIPVHYGRLPSLEKERWEESPEHALKVSDAALDLTEEELRYFIAFALHGATESAKGNFERMIQCGVAPILSGIAISLVLAYFVDWKWLVGIPLSFALAVLAPFFAVYFVDKNLRSAHLTAVHLTGDRTTGLRLLKQKRIGPRGGAKWLERRLRRTVISHAQQFP